MMTTDRLIRDSTAVTVSIVTVIAAYESYRHIAAVSHNPLLAFSIDGMLITSTLVLMAANRAKIEKMWLAYLGLWLGIIATLFANVAYGLPHGLLASAWSTWPAVCLVVSVETIAQLSKRKRTIRKRAVPATVIAVKEPVYARATTDRMKAHGVTTPEDLPNKGKVPGIKVIRRELSCGQPVAYQVQAIMARGLTDDIHKAKEIRDKEKADASSTTHHDD